MFYMAESKHKDTPPPVSKWVAIDEVGGFDTLKALKDRAGKMAKRYSYVWIIQRPIGCRPRVLTIRRPRLAGCGDEWIEDVNLSFEFESTSSDKIVPPTTVYYIAHTNSRHVQPVKADWVPLSSKTLQGAKQMATKTKQHGKAIWLTDGTATTVNCDAIIAMRPPVRSVGHGNWEIVITN